jgi:hypothetical protein
MLIAVPGGPVGAGAGEMERRHRNEETLPSLSVLVGAAAEHVYHPPKRLFIQHRIMCRSPPPALGRATA